MHHLVYCFYILPVIVVANFCGSWIVKDRPTVWSITIHRAALWLPILLPLVKDSHALDAKKIITKKHVHYVSVFLGYLPI